MRSQLTEPLQLLHWQSESKQMEKNILQTTSMSITVPNVSPRAKQQNEKDPKQEAKNWKRAEWGSHERTKRSLLIHLGFLGLNFINLLKRTWETGAMPIGAPGCPELAFEGMSTAKQRIVLMHFQSSSPSPDLCAIVRGNVNRRGTDSKARKDVGFVRKDCILWETNRRVDNWEVLEHADERPDRRCATTQPFFLAGGLLTSSLLSLKVTPTA
jgi:hypothetical protein